MEQMQLVSTKHHACPVCLDTLVFGAMESVDLPQNRVSQHIQVHAVCLLLELSVYV